MKYFTALEVYLKMNLFLAQNRANAFRMKWTDEVISETENEVGC